MGGNWYTSPREEPEYWDERTALPRLRPPWERQPRWDEPQERHAIIDRPMLSCLVCGGRDFVRVDYLRQSGAKMPSHADYRLELACDRCGFAMTFAPQFVRPQAEDVVPADPEPSGPAWRRLWRSFWA